MSWWYVVLSCAHSSGRPSVSVYTAGSSEEFTVRKPLGELLPSPAPCPAPLGLSPPPLLPHGQSSWKLLRSVILTFLSSSGERGPTPPPQLWSLAPSFPQSPAFLGDGMPWGGGAGVGLDPGQSLNPMASPASSGTICWMRRCVSCFL